MVDLSQNCPVKSCLTFLQNCGRDGARVVALWSLFGGCLENTSTVKIGTRGTCTLTVCTHRCRAVCLFACCLTSQQHVSVSQGRICSDNFTCCHSEIKVADPTFRLTQSQYTDTGPISPSTDPITPGRVATGVPIFKSLV